MAKYRKVMEGYKKESDIGEVIGGIIGFIIIMAILGAVFG